MRRRDNPERTTLYTALVLSAVYAALICIHGIPALRHDWFWPRERYGFIDVILNSTSGWNPAGIGAPNPYPGAYIIGTGLGLLGLIFAPLVTLTMLAFAIATSVTLGVRELANVLEASTPVGIALEIFALFNPWTYNETVAGHMYMLLAYGASFAILAELLRKTPRPRRLAVLLVLVLPQLQFFLIAMAALIVHGWLRRLYLPALSGIVIALPIWVGLAFDRSSLLHTPYTLAWESSQSVDPRSAMVLAGYFAGYTAHFNGFAFGAAWILVICACVSAVATQKRRLAAFSVIAIAVFLIWAMGTRGLLGSAYSSIVLRVPESGLFRELYDLLGFVAIGYCVLLACLPRSRNFQSVAVVIFVASTALASAWIEWPPSSYWVAREQLPYVKIDTKPQTRFALYPAYQPMQFNGKGSGADPDAYARPEDVTPLNEYFAQYPVDVALSSFVFRGNPRPLAALSVSLVVQRPWLNTDSAALRLQINGVLPNHSAKGLSYRRLGALPEVTLEGYPRVGSLVNVLGAGNIFIADARRVPSPPAPLEWRALPDFSPIEPSNAFVDETQGWTDVRFEFATSPDLGQGLGGAVTTNPHVDLPVRAGAATLVNVNGVLRSQDNAVVSRSTGGYAWINLPGRAHALRCEGRCVVVGQARSEPDVPLNPGANSYSATHFSTLTPWLVRVDVPPHAPPVLRYNVAFDENWYAISSGKPTWHVRLDATVNGWLLKKNPKPYVIYLVHRVALTQTVVEVLGMMWLIGVTLTSSRSRFKNSRQSPEEIS